MNISISPATKRLLNRKMKSGHYENADALVRDALLNLELSDATIEEFDEETRAALSRAEEQSKRGEGRSWESVKAEVNRRFLKK
jgi:Arc/MetJ-type ribon-helix-helix transcriptional regulator